VSIKIDIWHVPREVLPFQRWCGNRPCSSLLYLSIPVIPRVLTRDRNMPVWKLIIEYDGTRYSGWQEQKNSRTVVGEIKKAAADVLRSDVDLDGAGRTDAGVHALAQVARLKSHRAMSIPKLLRFLNNKLPKDIHVVSAQEIDPRFHPRHDAVRRYYLYQISTRRSAFAKKYIWWLQDNLDFELMKEATSLLVGRHDFERFADKRADEGSTIVVVDSAEMMKEGDLYIFRIGASHYLWRMVRRVVGCLVEVGLGNLSVSDFGALIEMSPLKKELSTFSVAAHTAPSSGLFLELVTYKNSELPPPLKPAVPVR